MNILVREWALSDFENISRLFLQVHHLHQSNRPDIYKAVAEPLSRADYDKTATDENAVALLAEVDGQVVGLSLTTLRQPSTNPLLMSRRVAWMENFCVDERYRRQGIGEVLFEKTKEKIKSRGYGNLELMVWAFNRDAIAFYAKQGMRDRSMTMEIAF